jgi:hypothetical protein
MPLNYTDINKLIKQTINATGSTNKEVLPPIHNKEDLIIKELVEHEPQTELKEFIKVRPETIKIPPDLTKIGVQTKDTPVKFPQYQNLKLPLSDEKIILGLNQPINSSWRWLATLALYLLKKAHLSLKVVEGRVVRIFKS